MKILFPLETLDMELKNLEQPNARDTIAYNIAAAIHENTDHNYNSTMKSITLGVSEPEKIIEIAEHWNESLITNFYIKCNAVKDHGIDFPLDTSDTYKLKLAVRELDNDWTPYGSVGIILPGEFSFHPIEFHTVMTESLLTDIKSHPENYAITNTSVFPSVEYRTTPCYDWDD